MEQPGHEPVPIWDAGTTDRICPLLHSASCFGLLFSQGAFSLLHSHSIHAAGQQTVSKQISEVSSFVSKCCKWTTKHNRDSFFGQRSPLTRPLLLLFYLSLSSPTSTCSAPQSISLFLWTHRPSSYLLVRTPRSPPLSTVSFSIASVSHGQVCSEILDRKCQKQNIYIYI